MYEDFINKKGFKHWNRVVVHSQIRYTDFKSSKKSLDFLDFFRIFRIFLSEQPFGTLANLEVNLKRPSDLAVSSCRLCASTRWVYEKMKRGWPLWGPDPWLCSGGKLSAWRWPSRSAPHRRRRRAAALRAPEPDSIHVLSPEWRPVMRLKTATAGIRCLSSRKAINAATRISRKSMKETKKCAD